MDDKPRHTSMNGLNDRWSARFKLYEEIGVNENTSYFEFVKLVARLPFSKMLSAGFSPFGCLFGFSYYFWLEMIPRGLVLAGLDAVACSLLAALTGIHEGVYYSILTIVPGFLLPFDYYMSKVHGRKMWRPLCFISNTSEAGVFLWVCFLISLGLDTLLGNGLDEGIAGLKQEFIDKFK